MIGPALISVESFTDFLADSVDDFGRLPKFDWQEPNNTHFKNCLSLSLFVSLAQKVGTSEEIQQQPKETFRYFVAESVDGKFSPYKTI